MSSAEDSYSTARLVAEDLYGRILKDPDLGGFFQGTDIALQVERMARALINLDYLVSPEGIEGFIRVHERLLNHGLLPSHLVSVLRHLGDAASANGIPISSEVAKQVEGSLGAALWPSEYPHPGSRMVSL